MYEVVWINENMLRNPLRRVNVPLMCVFASHAFSCGCLQSLKTQGVIACHVHVPTFAVRLPNLSPSEQVDRY